MEIRRARRDDVPGIVALYADDILGVSVENPGRLDGYYVAFDRLEKEEPSSELMVGEEQGRIVGTFQLTFITQLSNGGCKVAQIESVRVASDRRGRGLGEELLGWAVARARAEGCIRLQLTTNKQRSDAHRFYERLGFRRSHEGFKLPL